ncbi:hypothetical protein BH09MYX1_BH09MYX1_28680 [soil metagenome]
MTRCRWISIFLVAGCAHATPQTSETETHAIATSIPVAASSSAGVVASVTTPDASATITDAGAHEPLEVSARHILIRVGDFPNAKKRTLRQAHAVIEEVRKRVAAGEDFAELAKLYSEDPGTARAGGDLGPFGRGKMVKEFEDAVFALEPYELAVVETVFGVHLIQRTR